MKPTDTLTVMFSHNLWANLLLLEQCAELTSEQLDSAISGAYGSIRDTLEHIVKAEQSYFTRISTGQRHHFPKDASPMTLADMMDMSRRTGSGLIEWSPKVGAGDTVMIEVVKSL